jgi:hypothetical protein
MSMTFAERLVLAQQSSGSLMCIGLDPDPGKLPQEFLGQAAPLHAFDRRIVHNALKNDPGVETHSVEVDGTDKKAILLRPKH